MSNSKAAAPPAPTPPFLQVFGATAFALVFFFGHNLTRERNVFLDKICIHQTDLAKKMAGIQAIDQFIFRRFVRVDTYVPLVCRFV
jgi:hypothetical protein